MNIFDQPKREGTKPRIFVDDGDAPPWKYAGDADDREAVKKSLGFYVDALLDDMLAELGRATVYREVGLKVAHLTDDEVAALPDC